MTYIEINGVRHPVVGFVNGNSIDRDWDGRDSKTIRLEMTHAEAIETFVDYAVWSIIMEQERTVLVEETVEVTPETTEVVEVSPAWTEEVTDEEGNVETVEHEAVYETVIHPAEYETVAHEEIETYEESWDNSEYCFAGPVTDFRDGTVAVKMGKPTDLELAYEIMYGGI